jgi:Endonuclease-reverse transcriptase
MHGPISVCSVYLPPLSTWNCSDLLSLVSELPLPALTLGDFNSHSTLRGCSSTNQKGLEMEKFLIQSNWCLLNRKFATYLHPGIGTLSSLDMATACRGESSFISLCGISFRMRMPDPPVGVLLLSTSGSLETSEYCLLKNL